MNDKLIKVILVGGLFLTGAILAVLTKPGWFMFLLVGFIVLLLQDD